MNKIFFLLAQVAALACVSPSQDVNPGTGAAATRPSGTESRVASTKPVQSPSAATVTSKDGTKIAFEKTGKGPVLILVSGALSDRAETTRLAKVLSEHFTTINYDRRGRGDSGDTQPYAVAREIEDIEALIDAAGGSAFLFGGSSGAVLALEAAAALPSKVKKAALYEPPFVVDDSRAPIPADFFGRVSKLVAADKRSEAVELFMGEGVGVPKDMLEQMKRSPMWKKLEKAAHTIPYDGMVVGDTQGGKPLPAGRWRSATMPVLVMNGGNTERWMSNAAAALPAVLPNARHRTIEGQDHSIAGRAPQVLVPVLVEFFADQK